MSDETPGFDGGKSPSDGTERARVAERLHEADLDDRRFIDVVDGDKASHDHNQRTADDARLTGNYGIYAGRGAGDGGAGRLVDVDIDDYAADGSASDALEAVLGLPATLTVETPHTDGETGGHRFYAVTGDVVDVMQDVADGAANPSPSWGEVRVANQYVVGPGSELDSCDKEWHDCSEPGEGHYRITDDREIATIAAEQLADALRVDPAYADGDSSDETDYQPDGETDAEAVAREQTWIAEYLALGLGPDGDRSTRDHAVCREMVEQGVGEDDARALLDDSQHTKVSERGGDYWRRTWNSAVAKADAPADSAAATDGGAAAASAGAGTAAAVETDADALTPMSVMARAGLGEDDDISGLTDREKAYWVWQLVDDRDDYHLLAAVPDGEDNPESIVYRYEGGLWVPSGEQLLRQIGADALGPQYSDNVRREMVEQVRARAAKPRDVLETDPETLAVENGLLDIEDRDVRPLRPDDYALRRLGAEFDPDAECPRWREFLDDVVREGDIETLQEYVGYCLMHWQMPYKRAALLLGPQDSGKSTFLNVVRTLLGGSQNVSAENLNSLVNTRWGTANLHGKLANITNELETTALETLGTFKTITGGGDLLTAERKGRDPFQFEPVAKHMFAANRVPPAKDADDAFHERWLHIRFPEAVPKSEQVPQLDGRLIDEELSGILNWALEGYDRLTDQQQFTGDQAVGRKRELWEAYGHSVKRFKHNCLEVTGDSDDVIVKKIGHSFYAVFCEDWAGTEVESQSKFTRELTNDGKIGQGRRIVRDGGNQRTVYTGVKFDPQALEELEFDPGAALDAIRDDVDDDDPDDQQGSLGGFGDE